MPVNRTDGEAEPLLAENDHGDYYRTNSDLKPQASATRNSVFTNYYRRSWNWLRNNVKILALTSLLFAGLIALVIYIARKIPKVTLPRILKLMTKVNHTQAPEQPTDPICLSPACVVAAAGIIQNISPQKVDPCEDFSTYVCGGWEQKHDIGADQDSISSASVMYENSQQTLRHLLKSPYAETQIQKLSDTSADKAIFSKIQSAYNACLDEKTIKSRGSAPLLDILRNIEKDFPLKSSEDDASQYPGAVARHQKGLLHYGENPLTRTIAYLAQIGVDALVSFGVDADEKDPDSAVLMISALNRPGLPSKEYYEDKALVQRYAETIGLVLEGLLREARPSGSLEAESVSLLECSETLVEAIIQLETNLALASPDEADAEDVTKYYNPRSMSEVETLLPQIPVAGLLSTLAPAGFVPRKIIVGSPTYLEALSQQLEAAVPETIRAYLVWKVVQAYVNEIDDEAIIPLKRFNNELQGKDPDASEDRWKTCVRAVDRGLGISLLLHHFSVSRFAKMTPGWILSRFFVEEAFSEESKAFGDQIIYDIKDQFIQKLSEAEWMSRDVRKVAIEKVHRIVQKIGYPTKSPDVLDASAIRKYYEGVHISNESYFDNVLNIAKFDSRREWSKLGKPTNRDEWLMTAVTVNAYYNPPGNEIVFPAGIMQPPIFYDPSLPSYISYGPFGSISGHELTHAFDSNGRHYDENGNYTDWWDDRTIRAFQEKAECYVDQYSNFTILDPDGKELHVNGRLTLGENIADAGGLSAAFHAWKKIESKQPSQLLPGLQHFSKEQMFFITYPSLFCGKSRKERAVNLIYKDAHSPAWARILGTVANSGEFREAFNCPTKEPTCDLW
ncbi:MAG: hypothetical protein Q9222_005079 [Ikaeria aurantiellina]